MKRILILAVAVFGMAATLPAQDAAAIANQQAAQENYQSLAAKVDDLTSQNQSLRAQVNDLQSQLRTLLDAQSQPNTNSVDRSELRDLAQKVQEIDQKREDDKKLILSKISDLASLPPATAPTPRHHHEAAPVDESSSGDATATTPDTSADNKDYQGYEYVVKSGDTLMAIITAYNKQAGLHLTVEQVLKHPLNAKVKPNSLRVGQKIFIPTPAK